ncbi:MAG: AAA family ATPase, partial [Lentilitoribacter sp.]
QRGGRFIRNGSSVENPVAPLKETLIGFAAFGADNAHMKAVPELVGLYEGFQEILRTLLPAEIGFQNLEVRSPEIVVVTLTGEFPIDSASGGLMALIQTAWQIFLFIKANGSEAVVLIDEPENHLHPSLQRDFLSNLVRTFDQTQFVIATHSPFIISSVKDSRIYALRYVERNDGSSAVTAHLVDMQSKAGSATKILDEVLGVSVTIPMWAENELNEISAKFEVSELSQESIDRLRIDLEQAGLSQFFPEAVGRILRD